MIVDYWSMMHFHHSPYDIRPILMELWDLMVAAL